MVANIVPLNLADLSSRIIDAYVCLSVVSKFEQGFKEGCGSVPKTPILTPGRSQLGCWVALPLPSTGHQGRYCTQSTSGRNGERPKLLTRRWADLLVTPADLAQRLCFIIRKDPCCWERIILGGWNCLPPVSDSVTLNTPLSPKDLGSNSIWLYYSPAGGVEQVTLLFEPQLSYLCNRVFFL